MHLRKLFLITLFCGVSLTVFAHEAPVVDAAQQQQQDAVTSTQPETSTGAAWQPVSSNEPAANNTSSSTSEWQPVNSSAAPTNEAQNTTTQQASQQPTPVQDEVTTSSQSSSVNKRVARLEQQIANYNQMNLPQQVTDLQQKNAELQGQLEVAQHNLKTLTDQQKLYYQDLEQQVAQLEAQKNGKATTLAANKTSVNTAQNTTVTTEATTGFVEKSTPPTDDNAQNPQLTSGTSSENNVNVATNQNNSLSQATQIASAPLPSLSDADMYGNAFRTLSNKHFSSAQKQFTQYLKDYPKGRFAVNAHFWLGEIALMHERYAIATKQFQAVVTQYPHSSKVPDSKLKIAMIHAAQGKMTLARNEFTQIRKAYPGSTAAQLASIRLQQLANVTSTSVQ